MGIRAQLALGLAALLTVAGAVSATVALELAFDEVRAQSMVGHEERAFELLDRLIRACPELDRTRSSAACDALRAAEASSTAGPLRATAFGAELSPLLSLGGKQSPPDELVVEAFRTRLRQSSLGEHEGSKANHIALPGLATDGRRFVLRLTYGLTAVEGVLDARRVTVYGLLALNLAAVLLFGLYLGGRFLVDPIRRLTEAAERSGRQGASAADFPVLLAPEELAQLSASFAALLHRLDDQRDALAFKVSELTTTRDDLVRAERLAVVGRLAAGLAHELGNPLSAVLGLVEYLRTDPNTPDALRSELLGRIDGELLRMRETLGRLLDFSRATPPAPREVDLSEVARSAHELLAYHRKVKSLDFRLELEPRCRVQVDPDRLRQVVVNLVLNAADALEGAGQLNLRTHTSGDWVVLQVEDNGPGLSDEVLERLFDPFVTTKPIGEGTGLGLAICQRLVDEAGGQISARTNEGGRGAVFEIRLRRTTPADPTA